MLCVVYFEEVKDVYGVVDSRKFGKFRSDVLLVYGSGIFWTGIFEML